ncbi:MAG TPA: hypothetical protein VEH86_03835 [Candidatus Acidoferrum sp.]|nr:hypothetical protein [Candidatus Acidoferrum sp.]
MQNPVVSSSPETSKLIMGPHAWKLEMNELVIHEIETCMSPEQRVKNGPING